MFACSSIVIWTRSLSICMQQYCTSQSHKNIMRNSKQEWKVVKSLMLFSPNQMMFEWVCYMSEWRKLEAIKPQSVYCIFSFSHFGIHTENIYTHLMHSYVTFPLILIITDWVEAYTHECIYFSNHLWMNEFLSLSKFMTLLSFIDEYSCINLIIACRKESFKTP